MKIKFVASATFVFALLAGSIVYGQEAMDVSEITLEMSPGTNAPLPELKITFRKDGTALYNGRAGANPKGKHKATITQADFDQLAELIRRRKFSSLQNFSSQFSNFSSDPNFPAFSAATVTTGAVINGKRKTVNRAFGSTIDTSGAPPKELLEIEGAIWKLYTQMKWEKEGK